MTDEAELRERLTELRKLATDMGINLHVVSAMTSSDELEPTTVRRILGIDVITSPLHYSMYFEFLKSYKENQ